MCFIEHILSYFGYFKTKEKEIPNTISNIIWRVGFNLTEEQIKKCKFKPFYTSIPELTVESIGGIPNVGEYLTFKYIFDVDEKGYDNFLFVRIKITRVERVVAGEVSSFYAEIFGDVVSIYNRSYAKLLDLEENN